MVLNRGCIAVLPGTSATALRSVTATKYWPAGFSKTRQDAASWGVKVRDGCHAIAALRGAAAGANDEATRVQR